METPSFQKTPAKANRWFKAFVVFALLYGITFSLYAVFNWIFFLAAVYSLFMSFFLLPVQPKIFQQRPKQEPFNYGSRSGQAAADNPVASAQARGRKIVMIVVGVLFVMFMIPFMMGVVEGLQEVGDDTTISNSDSSEPTDVPQEDFVTKGNRFFNDQNYDSADWYYSLALDEDHNNMEAVYGKGIVLYNKGQTDEATTYFVKAYDGGFRYAWLSWVLGDMNDKQGRTERAVTLYKETLSLDSTYTDVYKRLADLEPANREKYLELAQKYTNN